MTTEKPVSRLIAGAYHSTYHQLVRFFHKRLGNSQDARDLSQDVFARWLKGGNDTSVQETRAFLFKIANNVLTDHWRYNQRKGRDRVSEWDDSLTAEVAQEEADPQVQLEHRQRLDRLYQVLNELPPRQREAFVLYRFDGLSQSDIAERMDITVSMVEKHIARALLQCKRAMNTEEQKDGE